MSGVLFDTSIYIAALRQGDAAILGLRRALRAGDRIWAGCLIKGAFREPAGGALRGRSGKRSGSEFGHSSQGVAFKKRKRPSVMAGVWAIYPHCG